MQEASLVMQGQSDVDSSEVFRILNWLKGLSSSNKSPFENATRILLLLSSSENVSILSLYSKNSRLKL